MSLILSRRDLNFVLYEWLKVEQLTRIARYADHSRETFDAALDTCEKIATNLFAPHNKKNDQHEPHFDGATVTVIPEVKTALKAFCNAGLMAAGQDYERGGMQLPLVVEKAGFAWFKGANIATSAYPFLTIGNANLLLAHGSAAPPRYKKCLLRSLPPRGATAMVWQSRSTAKCRTTWEPVP